VRLEGLGKLKKFTSSGIRTGDLPACSIVPHKKETEIKSSNVYGIFGKAGNQNFIKGKE
jgi:hypothetical protein